MSTNNDAQVVKIITLFLETYSSNIDKLEFESEPDYDKLISLFDDCVSSISEAQAGLKMKL